MNKRILFLILILFSTNTIQAEQFDNSMQWQSSLKKETQNSSLKMLGEAKFTYLIWDIYKSQLFTTSGTYSQDNDQVLLYKIEYLRDVKAEDLLNHTETQWISLDIEKNDYASYLTILKDIWPNISKGDSLTFIKKNNVSAFYYNDKFIGNIDEKDFSDLFLSIWLSEKTSEPKLRAQLLGNDHD